MLENFKAAIIKMLQHWGKGQVLPGRGQRGRKGDICNTFNKDKLKQTKKVKYSDIKHLNRRGEMQIEPRGAVWIR